MIENTTPSCNAIFKIRISIRYRKDKTSRLPCSFFHSSNVQRPIGPLDQQQVQGTKMSKDGCGPGANKEGYRIESDERKQRGLGCEGETKNEANADASRMYLEAFNRGTQVKTKTGKDMYVIETRRLCKSCFVLRQVVQITDREWIIGAAHRESSSPFPDTATCHPRPS